MKITHAVIVGVFSLGLTACADSAPTVAVNQPNDNYLSCRDLARAIQEASYYRESAIHSEGTEKKARFLLPISASTGPERAAEARIKVLKDIYSQKRCQLSRFSGAYMQQMTPLPPIYN